MKRRSVLRPVVVVRTELPVELWELILDEMSDDNLLVIARTSRALNELAIRIYLHRNNVDLSTGTIHIRSHLIRALFILACEPVGVTSLRVTFWTFGVGRGILMLREIAKKWPNLTEIRLDWPQNVLGMRDDMEDNYRKKIRAEVYLAALWDLVERIALRGGGPFVLVAGGSLHRCEKGGALPRAKVRFSEMYPSRQFWLIKRIFGRRRRSQEKPHFDIRALADNFRVHRVDEIRVRRLPNQGDMATLVELESPTLALRPTKSLSAADISALLPHIQLRMLTSLELGSSEIDPRALHDFLKRHPQLATFKLACGWNSPSRPICEPAAQPRAIARVVCHQDVSGLQVLLDAFGHAPPLNCVEFTLCRRTPEERRSLTQLLTRLEQDLRPISLEMDIVLPSDLDPGPPAERDELAALTALHCVRWVQVTTESLANVERLLPWLSHMPDLLQFECHRAARTRWGVQEDALLEFKAAAQKAMPTAYVWVAS